MALGLEKVTAEEPRAAGRHQEGMSLQELQYSIRAPEPREGRHVCRTDRDIVRATPARGETGLLDFYRLRHVEQIFCKHSTPTGSGRCGFDGCSSVDNQMSFSAVSSTSRTPVG
jgi:hypothetical protein